MFYKLKRQFALRGYKDLPYVLVDLTTGNTSVLSPAGFQALSFCDGFTDLNSFYVLPIHKEIINKLLKEENPAKKIVEICEEEASLLPEQKYKYFDNYFIQMAHWSITGKCNYKCRHCYLHAPDAKYGELSTSECLRIVNELADCGIMQVSITGGEPLVRKDFFEILDAIKSKNLVVTYIYTNGALVNEKLLDELEKRGMKPEFSISFDGVGWHDWLRGVKGAEKMAVRAFDLLKKRGFPVDVELCIHKLNKGVLEDSINFLEKHGVLSVKTNPVSNSGAWISEKGKYDLTREELYSLYLDYIPKFLKAGSPLTLHLGGFFFCRKGSKSYSVPVSKFDGTDATLNCKLCAHAKNNMYIGPDGQLLPCMSLAGLETDFEKTYLQNHNLRDLLNSSTYSKLVNGTIEELLEKNEECNKCSYKLTCGGGCRASAYLYDGKYFGCDRASCDIFKKNYINKIKEAVSVCKAEVI